MIEKYNIILFSFAILFWLSGFWFLYRIPFLKNKKNIIKFPKLSIIIPARNEELNIGNLLDSINVQSYLPDEIIVINDFSTDSTKYIALEKGATVIDSKVLPNDWLGKPWSCFQGAEYAKNDLFLFLDSDTVLNVNGLKNILENYVELSKSEVNNYDIVISISPYHNVINKFEEYSSIFNIIMTGSMNAFTPNTNSEPNGMFGQSLLISKSNYFAINGHESVKNRILENLFMVEKFKEANIKLKCYGGKGTLAIRMYSNSFRDLVNGWSKAFASGATQIPLYSLFNIILWITGGFIAFIYLTMNLINSKEIIISVLLYLLFAAQIYWMLYRIGSFRFSSALFFPLHLILFCIVFTRSLILKITKKSIQWKTRDVVS